MSDRWCFLIERMMTPKSRERVVFTMLGVKVDMFVENSCDLRILTRVRSREADAPALEV